MSLDRVLRDLRDELVALWGGGLATPGPGRAEALRSLAETMVSAGLATTAQSLRALADDLDRIVDDEPSRERLVILHERLQALMTWETQLRRSWSLRACREALAPAAADARAPRRAPGLDGPVIPLGIVADDGRIRFVLRIQASGERVILHDEWPGPRVRNRFRAPAASRLFQDRVVPAQVMLQTWRLDDHPAVRRRGGWVGGPSFFTRPGLTHEPVHADSLPDVLHVSWSSDGWTLWRDDGEGTPSDRPVDVVRSPELDFNLRKQRFFDDRIDALLVPNGDEHVIAAMAGPNGGRCFPMVDPAAVTWPPAGMARIAESAGHSGVRALAAQLGIGTPPARRVPTTVGEAVVGWLGGAPTMPRDDAEEAALVLAAVGAAPPEVVERVARSWLPADPTLFDVVRRALSFEAPSEARSFVEAHVTALGRAVRRGAVLPPGRELWALSALWARYAGVLGDPRDGSLNGLPLELDRLRLAAVNPIARAMRGEPVPPEELEDGLLIVLGCDDAAQLIDASDPTPRQAFIC